MIDDSLGQTQPGPPVVAERLREQPTSAKQAVQFCIGLENKPGTFAKLCAHLTRAEVNIRALFISEEGKYSWVHLIGDPSATTEQALTEGGYKFFTEQVLTVRVQDRRGELERISERLAEANVNIAYIYGSGTEGSEFSLVLNTAELSQAMQALES